MPLKVLGGWLLTVSLALTVPIAEIWTIILVSGRIGWWPTVGLVLVTSVIGLLLLMREGTKAWRSLSTALRDGRMPSRELVDASLILVGGLALLVPGLLSDLLGLALLIPFTRVLVRRVLGSLLARQLFRDRQRAGVIVGETTPVADAGSDGVVAGRLLP